MENKIDLMVKEVAKNLGVQPPKPKTENPPKPEKVVYDKPKRNIVSAKDINIDGVSLADICEQIKKAGNIKIANALLAIAELINLDDEAIEKMLMLIKPNSSTKAEYLLFAAELIQVYKADMLADVMLSKMNTFETAGMLLKQK